MRQKLRRDLILIRPLAILTILSVSLFIFRSIIIGSTRFLFLNWNLLLAWVPIFMAWLASYNLSKYRWKSWQVLLPLGIWLLFLPNSFYLITDFIHLQYSYEEYLVYDAVLLASFALSGLLLGLASLYLVHKQFARKFGRENTWIMVQVVLLLSSFAIYLGRNLRWNSWDLILYPANILFDVFVRLSDILNYPGFAALTAMFYAFLSLIYAAFYDLLNQRSKR